MIILIKLILAHFVGDFWLQPKLWVEKKEKNKIKSLSFYFHIFIHGALVLLILWDLSYWLLASLIILIHGLIDIIKLYAQKEKTKPQWFFIDQILHLGSIMVLWIIYFKPEVDIIAFLEKSTIWIYITALFFITVVTSVAVNVLMQNWANQINDRNENGEKSLKNDKSLKNAGKYIGMLERLFVFTFVITGHWQAIGFLLAAKSVFRFGDLKESKERKLTEYILIGTLLSFGIAISSGLIVLKIVE
jgi:hypothetical protein